MGAAGPANLQAQLKARTAAMGGGGYSQAAAAKPSLFPENEKVEAKPIFEQKVPEQAPTAAPAEIGELTLAELQDASIWRGKDIIATERERYLPDAVFASLFGMDKEAFAKLPKWKRDNKKKEHGLF